MANNRKLIRREISLWKKRISDSRKVLEDVYKDVSKEAKKAYKDVIK